MSRYWTEDGKKTERQTGWLRD